MQLTSYDVPRPGHYLTGEVVPASAPVPEGAEPQEVAEELVTRPCLILGWDDHSERFLVADLETGKHGWELVDDVLLDCSEYLAMVRDEPEKPAEPMGEPCPYCKRPTDGSSD